MAGNNHLRKQQMIYLKPPEEIELMGRACDLTSRTLAEMAKWVAPGVTTNKLDSVAKEFILDNGGRPACLGYGGFPGAVCMEVNEIVVHGFPSSYTLREGDIIGLDVHLHATQAAIAQWAEENNVDACREGNRIGDIANAVQTYCERRGYSVVREMCGHGIGRKMHEDPEVPNYGRRGTGPVIRNGLCIAIEPMINLGSRNIVIEADGWTCRTRDRKPSAHYEHTVAVLDGQTRILTTFDYVAQVLGDRFI